MEFIGREKPKLTKKELVTRIVIGVVVTLLLFGVYSLVNLFLRYWFLSIAVVLGGIIYLAHTIGTALMFPGAFSYFRGGIEMAYSTDMSKSTHLNLMYIEKSCIYVLREKDEDAIKFYPTAEKSIEWMIGLLGKFQVEGSLSKRKTRLLALYRELHELLLASDSEFISIHDYILSSGRGGMACKVRADQVIHLINHIRDLYKEFFPTLSSTKMLYYQCKEEKLFEIRFGLYTYDKHYHYKHHLLQTDDKQQIEFIVIESILGREPPAGKPTVVFCNPNGAFMQLIAMECKYIDFYLEQGYCVCLWNYRGYGRSTGKPSLSTNEKDVLEIHEKLSNEGYAPKIAHGYSIGGPLAIYLACLRPMSMLIADRTFGSIELLAKDYGSVFFSIMKLIFYNDRRDYTALYLNTRCRKLIICDPYDEVIRNTASLKNGVAEEAADLLGPEQSANSQPYLVLNEQSTNLFLKLGVMFKKVSQDKETFLGPDFVQAFLLNTMPFVLRISNPRRRDPEDLIIEEGVTIAEAAEHLSKEVGQSFKIEEPVESASNHLAQEVTDILMRLDSAGMQNLSNDIKHVRNHDKDSLQRETEAYLNGLVIFGSYCPYRRKYKDPSTARHDTVLKIYQVAKELSALQQKTQSEPHARALSGIRHQLSRIGLYLYENLHSDVYDQVGVLLPTRAGHNGELNLQQYQMLSEFVSDMSE